MQQFLKAIYTTFGWAHFDCASSKNLLLGRLALLSESFKYVTSYVLTYLLDSPRFSTLEIRSSLFSEPKSAFLLLIYYLLEHQFSERLVEA
jgi:hypothetical protein